MEPLAALGLCSSILQIVDFSCKILSKGNELRASLSGALPENVQLEKVITHLHGLVTGLQQQPPGQGRLKDMVAECITNANELLVVLEGLEVKGNAKRWTSWRQAVKTVWRKDRIEGMLGRLELMRDQIEFGIILDMKDDLQNLVAQQSIRFDNLDHSTRAVLQAVIDGQSASAAAADIQIRAMEDLSSKLEMLIMHEHHQTRAQILAEIRQQNMHTTTRGGLSPVVLPQVTTSQQPPPKTDVLVMLKFTAIDDRYDQIPDVYRKTFQWIWQDHRYTQRGGSNFWYWLTTQQGIFWVSGKAGSGKSTLMKYINNDHRAKLGLAKWANGEDFVTASFFFWNSGSVMQKSFLGLLQNILYEILLQRADLTDTVFPQELQENLSTRWNSRVSDVDSIWSLEELKSGFQRLLQIPSLKICLFVDGLDEYEGSDQEVAELFAEIITSPSVKACLSSRPHVVFQRSFSLCPTLRLQDLTYADINLYVREKLVDPQTGVYYMSKTEPWEYEQLIEEIIAKASGVFLWVHLIVRSLLDGHMNYDRMADLRHRLREFPDDLNDLYWHMLRAIKPNFYLVQAAKLLMIMLAAYRVGITISMRTLAIAEEYTAGEALCESPYQSAEVWHTQASNMEGRLVSRCLGLLEVKADETVAFLHQSVIDFLEREEVKHFLGKHTNSSFNPNYSLLSSYLSYKGKGHGSEIWTSPNQSHLDLLFSLARNAEKTGMLDPVLMGEFENIHREDIPDIRNDTYLTLCLQRGLIKYVSYKLDHGESMHQGPQKRPLLDFVVDMECIHFWKRNCSYASEIVEVCRTLFARGADPSEMFGWGTVWEHVLARVDSGYPFGDIQFPNDITRLIKEAGYIGNHSARKDLQKFNDWEYGKFDKHWIWIEIMHIFLDNGADPNAGIVTYCTGSHDDIKPAALFLRENIIPNLWPTDRRRALELYDKIVALGGTTERYQRPMRKVSRIAYRTFALRSYEKRLTTDDHDDLEYLTSGKNKVARPCPDHEGMIPVSTDPDHAAHLQSPPSLPQLTPNRPYYQQLSYMGQGSTDPTQTQTYGASSQQQQPYSATLSPYPLPTPPTHTSPAPATYTYSMTPQQSQSPYSQHSVYPPSAPPTMSHAPTSYQNSPQAVLQQTYTPPQTAYQTYTPPQVPQYPQSSQTIYGLPTQTPQYPSQTYLAPKPVPGYYTTQHNPQYAPSNSHALPHQSQQHTPQPLQYIQSTSPYRPI